MKRRRKQQNTHTKIPILLHNPKELSDFSFVNIEKGDAADTMHSSIATDKKNVDIYYSIITVS